MPQSEDLGIASIAGQHEKSDTGHQQADEVGEQTEHGGHRTDDRWAQNQHIRLLGTLRFQRTSLHDLGPEGSEEVVWGAPSECLSWPPVELVADAGEVVGGVHAQAGAFGK